MISVDEFQDAVRSCRYCPMCQYADLTATLQRRETYSARGRALLLAHIERFNMERTSEFADPIYGYFTDGLCREMCAGHINHDEMVVEARRRLVAAGKAPSVVSTIRENIETKGNPWGADEPDIRALTGAARASNVLLYVGSAARIRRPSVVTALATLMKRADTEFSVLTNEGDPGLLLHQLGEADAGGAVGKALAKKIVETGARLIVTADAEAYYALRHGFGTLAPLQNVDVLHISEFLLKTARKLRFRGPAGLRIVYHDPCLLARFARCTEAPRTLISQICDAPPVEIEPWNRERANCSGECGGVPFTQPELAKRASQRRVHEALSNGAEIIVCGSPASAAVLSEKGVPVQEISEFAAASLD